MSISENAGCRYEVGWELSGRSRLEVLAEFYVKSFELERNLLPESRLMGGQGFSYVLPIIASICNDFSVELTGNWSGISPVQSDRVKENHSDQVESA